MKVFIKNMVCDRCIMAVKFELLKLGIVPINVNIGRIELNNELAEFQHQEFYSILQGYGFEILDKNNNQIIEKIKDTIVELVNTHNNNIKTNYSADIEKKLERNYTYVNNLFSEVEGITIEQFITLQRVKKVKRLLEQNECKLFEIAAKLGYSNVTYLSTQFKKTTGFTPNYFKKIKNKKRVSFATVAAHQEYDISIVDKSNARTVVKIKNIVIELVHGSSETKKINYSEYIEQKLKVEYKYLNKLFSEIEEVTIEQYIILQKTEKVKELLVYKEYDLSEISKILGYGSNADLLSELKEITGLTTNFFGNIKDRKQLLQNNFKSVNNIKRIRKSIGIKKQ